MSTILQNTITKFTPKTINLDLLLKKINELLIKGENVKMKNKEKFKFTLEDTKKLMNENMEHLCNLKSDQNYSKIMVELNLTILDLESKLYSLSLIKFCRDKAEKYLAQVTEKLYNINLVIISLLGNKLKNNNNEDNKIKNKNEEKENEEIQNLKNNNNVNNANNKKFLDEIEKLNHKLKEMENTMNNLNNNNLQLKNNIIIPELPLQNENNNNSDNILLEGLISYLGLEDSINLQYAHENFTIASQMNNSRAKIILARMYEKGEYVDKSITKAIELYKEAANLINSVGYFELAEYNLNNDENNSEENINETLELYNKSMDLNNTDAMTKLGIIYENGLLNQEINNKKSIEFYKHAIDIDENTEAINKIGVIYYRGNILKQNFTLASESFQRAAKLGNTDALNNLGMCYEYGKGVEKNLDKALNLYRTASEKMHPSAISNQAILMIKINTNFNKKQFKEPFRLLNLTIQLDRNNKDAFYYLGFLYEKGYGVKFNPNLAFYNYKKAAKLNHIKAKTKLGLVLFNGLENVVDKNEEEAISLLNEAAMGNEPEALNHLGLIYENIDPKKSKEYFTKSYQLGYENAGINLALINSNFNYNFNGSNHFTNNDKNLELETNYKNHIEKLSKKGNFYAKSMLNIMKNNQNTTRNPNSSNLDNSNNFGNANYIDKINTDNNQSLFSHNTDINNLIIQNYKNLHKTRYLDENEEIDL